MSPSSADVVVLGAGAVGAMITWRLAGRGHRVVVVDPQGPLRGSSGSTFAWTASHSKAPLYYHRFSGASIERYQSMARELDPVVDWRPCASFTPVLEGEDVDAVRDTALRKDREGYTITWLDAQAVHERVPALGPEVVGASVCEPEGTVNPFTLVMAALHAARRHGARARWGERAVALEREGDRVVAVRTEQARIPCGHVVNATGWRASEIGRMAGLEVPVQPVKGEVLVTERHPPLLQDVVAEVQQTPTGNFLIGVTWEEGRTDAAPSPGHMPQLARRPIRLLPVLQRLRVIRSYAGIRPIPPENIPIIGPSSRRPGLLWAVGHSGITLAPMHAEVIADFVEGRTHPEWDPRYSPDRFDPGEPPGAPPHETDPDTPGGEA